MAAKSFTKQLEEIQLKISNYGLEEAKLKKEKAEVELETAKIHQAYVCQMMERESAGRFKVAKGGYKS